MALRPVQLRARAADDIGRAVDGYLGEAGESVALTFVDSFEHAVGRIGGAALVGTMRFSYELDIPNLRAWPMSRFPYVIFYVAKVARVEVWRVLPSADNT